MTQGGQRAGFVEGTVGRAVTVHPREAKKLVESSSEIHAIIHIIIQPFREHGVYTPLRLDKKPYIHEWAKELKATEGGCVSK